MTVRDSATLTRRASEGPRWRVGLVCSRFAHGDIEAESRATCWQPISSSVMIGASVPSLSERPPMTEVTRILSAIEQGEPHAAEQLLPLVYDELRKLATKRLAREKPGQTLQATALVHEAYLRLVGEEEARHWDSRGHFFAAAAEAMRRILIDQARRRGAEKHGALLGRIDLPELARPTKDNPLDLLALAEALVKLEE